MRVRGELRPGLLESTHATCLAHELSLAGIRFRRELALPVRYRGVVLESGFRIDPLVDGVVVVEVKAVDTLMRVHESQLPTYLKLTGLRTGLLVNFNVRLLKDGVRRLVR